MHQTVISDTVEENGGKKTVGVEMYNSELCGQRNFTQITMFSQRLMEEGKQPYKHMREMSLVEGLSSEMAQAKEQAWEVGGAAGKTA
jgi:hypothetical protein